MKKAFILLFLSLFTYGAIYADVTWKMSNDGTLTISGTQMDDYEYSDAPWSFLSEKIEKVVKNILKYEKNLQTRMNVMELALKD